MYPSVDRNSRSTFFNISINPTSNERESRRLDARYTSSREVKGHFHPSLTRKAFHFPIHPRPSALPSLRHSGAAVPSLYSPSTRAFNLHTHTARVREGNLFKVHPARTGCGEHTHTARRMKRTEEIKIACVGLREREVFFTRTSSRDSSSSPTRSRERESRHAKRSMDPSDELCASGGEI